jgi:superoxide dismutase, Cu-Zn family
MQRKYMIAAAAAVCLVGCDKAGDGTGPDNGQVASTDATPVAKSDNAAGPLTAALQTAEGEPAGTATVTAEAGGVLLALNVDNIPPGQHGAHIHMVGRCDAPRFESAGGHWNPANKEHGLENPRGQHAGDMPNLTVDADGRGTLSYSLKGATIEGIGDADGSAFVIHKSPDDQKTDPSGNSGDRLACGVFG